MVADSLTPTLPVGDSKADYAVISLGCPKNLVDTERMLGLLQLDGYRLVEDPMQSQFVVVNTCGFIEQARTESYAAIREMVELKRQGHISGVIVSGCLAERQKETLLAECPEIDQLVGVFGREEITKVADRLLGHQAEQRSVFRPAPINAFSDRQRLRVTPRHYAYLKISEGCDRLCTFCAIPKMRGKHASKPIEEIVAEAQELAASGATELIIIAQDTTFYGIDIYGRPRLAELLAELDQIDGIRWIRLMYFYPMYIDDVLIETIANSSHILPYIDLPLQHINNDMLRRMSRRVSREKTESLLTRLREGIENLALRTTFITGFPGETEEQFEELLEFANEQRFERLGVFTYSLEPDTPAAALPDHLSESVKEQRRSRLMEVQQEIAFSRNASLVGQEVEVVIDTAVPGESNAWVGRTSVDAPDVDAAIYITGDDLAPGQYLQAEVVGSSDYDLVGVANTCQAVRP